MIFGCWTSLVPQERQGRRRGEQPPADLPVDYEGLEHLAEHRLHRADPQPAGHPGGQLVLRDAQGAEVLPRRLARTSGRTRSTRSIKDQLKAMGAEAVGEEYVALDGGEGMAELIAAIKAARPGRRPQHGGRRRQHAVLPAAGRRPG